MKEARKQKPRRSRRAATRLLSEAWSARMASSAEECLLRFQELQSLWTDLHGTPTAQKIERGLVSVDGDLFMDAVLLQSSILRMQKRYEESWQSLDLIESVLNGSARARPFWLLFERGMHLFLSSDNSIALEYFTLAIGKARTPFEQLCARANQIFCLHNLGLPYRDGLAKVDSLLAQLAPTPYTRAVREQREVLALYSSFDEGNIPLLFSEHDSDFGGTQGRLIRAWVAALPYHAFHAHPDWGPESFAKTGVSWYQYAYCSRTLLGLLHPEDQAPARLSDWADRLYLWVWRWLVQPQAFPLDRVMALLTPLTQTKELYLLNVEDRQLVRNALLWLGLFDASSRRSLDSLLRLVPLESNQKFPLFALEEVVIHYWMAIRDNEPVVADDYLAALRAHPLYRSPALYFSHLVEGVEDPAPETPPQLLPLLRHLAGSLERLRQGSHPISVDFITFQIQNRERGTTIISEPICRALECLRASGTVSLEELMAACYGIPRFDAVIHTPKIFNLLSRMKRVLDPALRFRVKSGALYAEGDWPSISFKHGRSARGSLFTQPRWREAIYKSHQSATLPTPATSRPSAGFPPTLGREDLERLCRKSKATVNRLIARWETKGWIERLGSGRSTHYRLTPFLQNELREGRLI